MENQIFESNLDGELVFCKYVIVKGRIILPKKGKCICFRVKIRISEHNHPKRV